MDRDTLSLNYVASIPFALVSTIGLPAPQVAHFKSAQVMFAKPVSAPIEPFSILTICGKDGVVDCHAIVLFESNCIKDGKPYGARSYQCVKFLKRGKRNQKPWLDFVRPNCTYSNKAISNYVLADGDFPFFALDFSAMMAHYNIFLLGPLPGQQAMPLLARIKAVFGVSFFGRFIRLISKGEACH